MRLYIIAAALFVTAFLVLGVLAANLIEPAPPPSKPRAAAAPPRAGGGGLQNPSEQSPSEPTYPAAMPPQRAAGMQGRTPGMPGMSSTMPGMPSTGIPPGPSGISGISGSIGISAPPALPMPKPSSIEPTNSVPIIQPTDLGNAPTPTAGKQHQ